VADALGVIGRDLGLANPSLLARLHAAWPELVGPALAAHAEPRSLRDGVLTVAVDAPGWATQLRYLEAELLRRAEEVVGEPVANAVRVTQSGQEPPGLPGKRAPVW
jgi:predicted nucleic acid-binding Zn ribbon protein